MNPISWFTSTSYPSDWVKGQDRVFENVKSLALKSIGISSRRVSDFDFRLGSHTAHYEVGGVEKSIDLKAIVDPGFQSAYGTYAQLSAKNQERASAGQIYAHCKGNQYGLASLKRVANLPIRDPSSVIEAQPEEIRPILSRRFAFAEHFLKNWQEMLKMKLEDKELDPVKKRAIQRQLRELQSMDTYALYTALEHYPVSGEMNDLNDPVRDDLAGALEKKVLSDIRSTKWFSNSTNKYEREYAKDVAGLLYQDRESYRRYFRKAFGYGKIKKENICDILVREAVSFAKGQAGGEEYSAAGVLNSVLFQGMANDAKKELQDSIEGLGRIAHHSISEDGKEVDEETFKKYAETSSASGLIPDPPIPKPSMSSLIKTTAGLGVMGAGAYAVQHFTGYPVASALPNVLALRENIPLATFTIAAADSVKNLALSYFAPRFRSGNGRPKRQLNLVRLAGGVTLLAASAYFGYLPEAAALASSTAQTVAEFVWNHPWQMLMVSTIGKKIVLPMLPNRAQNVIEHIQHPTEQVARARGLSQLYSFASGYFPTKELVVEKTVQGASWAWSFVPTALQEWAVPSSGYSLVPQSLL